MQRATEIGVGGAVLVRAQMRLRQAAAADFEAIRDLQDALDTEHARLAPAIVRALDAPRFRRADVLEWIESANCCFLIAEHRGEVVGFIDASLMLPAEPDEVAEPWCSIHHLAVMPGQRRTGIGTALLRAAEAWAGDQGLTQVRLDVFAFNAGAKALYERLGYATFSQRMIKSLGSAAGGGGGRR